MLINILLEKKKISKYMLSKLSGVPQTTINDICSGKADVNKCTAGTLYKISKVLGITIEDIIETSNPEYRLPFDSFKSVICHKVKRMGDIDFMLEVLEKDEIRSYFNREWYLEALYLLAMIDYLSRENDIPICTNYDDIRRCKLEKPVYPTGVLILADVLDSKEPIEKAEREAIPEFKRFNIIEADIRNVV